MPPKCPTPRKIRFKTRDRANRAARRLLREKGFALYPYQCPCGWWHLTSSRQKGLTDPEPDMSLQEAERLVSGFLRINPEQVRSMPRFELYRRLVGEDDS
jgi:hypothetical protein